MSDIVVKKSRIHGQGVFAGRDFKKGEVVIDWSTCSDRLTKEEVNKLLPSQKKYVSFLKDNVFVLFKPPGKYVNHSCDSNTYVKEGCDVAVRMIRKGEEITADYVREKVPGLHLNCNCGSKKCQGVIKMRT
ncbi:MAG: SET domain-containing protein-lysine N-methyltransferase [Nanoarchaeota archaeon]